jgi:hypothetical protein
MIIFVTLVYKYSMKFLKYIVIFLMFMSVSAITFSPCYNKVMAEVFEKEAEKENKEDFVERIELKAILSAALLLVNAPVFYTYKSSSKDYSTHQLFFSKTHQEVPTPPPDLV